MITSASNERLRRWRLILGDEAGGIGIKLSDEDMARDEALGELYNQEHQAGLGSSNPNIARWLGDIRTYFPKPVVQIMQKDAIERLDMKRLLLEPELLDLVEPDVHMVATLIALKDAIPETTRNTARLFVRKVTDELIKKLRNPMEQAIRGRLNRAVRNRRPRQKEIDWPRTIRANLKYYQPAYRSIIPQTLIGFGHKRSSLREVILCVDQSGSMGTSVVYSGIFGAVMSSVPALKTHMVVFDTSVVDLSEELEDPVDLLFGVRLGGGTDINQALAYCQSLVRRPSDTVLVLISDLYEGGNKEEMLRRMATLHGAGVQVVMLLALNDEGAPIYDARNAEELAAIGIPSFACTPDLFPDLMAAALGRQDLAVWAARHDIKLPTVG